MRSALKLYRTQADMTITVPASALVILIGASGAGKSTFAKKWFKESEVLSSDHCRLLVSDDDNDQSATDDAFDVLYLILAKRLRRGRLSVVDATNVQPASRMRLLACARDHSTAAIAIVFDVPDDLCFVRRTQRLDRTVPMQAVRDQLEELRESLCSLVCEGFQQIYILKSVEEVDSAVIARESEDHETARLAAARLN